MGHIGEMILHARTGVLLKSVKINLHCIIMLNKGCEQKF